MYKQTYRSLKTSIIFIHANYTCTHLNQFKFLFEFECSLCMILLVEMSLGGELEVSALSYLYLSCIELGSGLGFDNTFIL